jgi:hypothetical protein
MNPASDNPAPSGLAPPPKAVPEQIDLEQLAEKVYRLLLADLRLEQARAAQTSRRRVLR